MIESTQALPSGTRNVYWARTVYQHSQHEFSWPLHPPDKEGVYTIVIIPQMETQKHKEVSHVLKVTLVTWNSNPASSRIPYDGTRNFPDYLKSAVKIRTNWRKRQLPRNISNPWGLGGRQPKDQLLTVLLVWLHQPTPHRTNRSLPPHPNLIPLFNPTAFHTQRTAQEHGKIDRHRSAESPWNSFSPITLSILCYGTMQHTCLENVPSQQDLHTSFESTESWGARKLNTFYRLLSQLCTFCQPPF